MPLATPVTTPEDVPIVIAVPEVLQVPPATPSTSVTDAPVQTEPGPVMAVGTELTVTTILAVHPVELMVYVIAAVPGDNAVTRPDVAPTVATDVVPLVHAPPGVASVNVVVESWHSELLPAIAAGDGVTLMVLVTIHPVPSE